MDLLVIHPGSSHTHTHIMSILKLSGFDCLAEGVELKSCFFFCFFLNTKTYTGLEFLLLSYIYSSQESINQHCMLLRNY